MFASVHHHDPTPWVGSSGARFETAGQAVAADGLQFYALPRREHIPALPVNTLLASARRALDYGAGVQDILDEIDGSWLTYDGCDEMTHAHADATPEMYDHARRVMLKLRRLRHPRNPWNHD